MKNMDLILGLATILGGIAALWYFKDKLFQKNKDVNIQLRPHRLSLYNETREFLDYCSTYRTKQLSSMVNGTQQLVIKIDTFKKKVDQLGPLSMPEVENKIAEIITNAW